ncbi:MAG: right-handed parallel beta-helix repeat-containing protein [Aeromicrobium sp.]|nr:right-handed parallel beta-helix repeat-containing protein [Burkholderiales bacterium]
MKPQSLPRWCCVLCAAPLYAYVFMFAAAADTVAISAAKTVAETAADGVIERSLKAGLRDNGGVPRATPLNHMVKGRTIDVTRYGADIKDSATDDRPAIEAALNGAKPGDEIYFPNGVYNLNSPATNHPNVHILLRSGVNIRGESEAAVLLKSNFDVGLGSRPDTVMRGQDVSDILVSNLSITSTWDRRFPTSPRSQNPDRGGPMYAIAIEAKADANQRITFEAVRVERYARMGILVGKGSSDVVIRRCHASNATDIGGGGAGYGFVLQGRGHQSALANPYLGTSDDNYFNVIEYSTANGPYIRHGALIQYWAHHNVIRHSTFDQNVYDAIDLHGEDEYLNEVAHNTITNTSAGAGIGLGNSGAGHDKTGPWNWIHHNTIRGSMRGMTVEYGTADNLIEDNIITGNNSYAGQVGIALGSVKGIVIRRNQIIDNNADGFSAFRFFMNRAEGEEPAGSPANNRIDANIIRGNAGAKSRAFLVEAESGGNVIQKNIVGGNTDNSVPKSGI